LEQPSVLQGYRSGSLSQTACQQSRVGVGLSSFCSVLAEQFDDLDVASNFTLLWEKQSKFSDFSIRSQGKLEQQRFSLSGLTLEIC
jgi:hypothetical protein